MRTFGTIFVAFLLIVATILVAILAFGPGGWIPTALARSEVPAAVQCAEVQEQREAVSANRSSDLPVTSASVVEVPAAITSQTGASSVCRRVGEWDALGGSGATLIIPQGCEVWFSTDAATVAVNGVERVLDARATLVVEGPANVVFWMEDPKHTHFDAFEVGTSNEVNNRDGAVHHLYFQGGQYFDRPEIYRAFPGQGMPVGVGSVEEQGVVSGAMPQVPLPNTPLPTPINQAPAVVAPTAPAVDVQAPAASECPSSGNTLKQLGTVKWEGTIPQGCAIAVNSDSGVKVIVEGVQAPDTTDRVFLVITAVDKALNISVEAGPHGTANTLIVHAPSGSAVLQDKNGAPSAYRFVDSTWVSW